MVFFRRRVTLLWLLTFLFLKANIVERRSRVASPAKTTSDDFKSDPTAESKLTVNSKLSPVAVPSPSNRRQERRRAVSAKPKTTAESQHAENSKQVMAPSTSPPPPPPPPAAADDCSSDAKSTSSDSAVKSVSSDSAVKSVSSDSAVKSVSSDSGTVKSISPDPAVQQTGNDKITKSRSLPPFPNEKELFTCKYPVVSPLLPRATSVLAKSVGNSCSIVVARSRSLSPSFVSPKICAPTARTSTEPKTSSKKKINDFYRNMYSAAQRKRKRSESMEVTSPAQQPGDDEPTNYWSLSPPAQIGSFISSVRVPTPLLSLSPEKRTAVKNPPAHKPHDGQESSFFTPSMSASGPFIAGEEHSLIGGSAKKKIITVAVRQPVTGSSPASKRALGFGETPKVSVTVAAGRGAAALSKPPGSLPPVEEMPRAGYIPFIPSTAGVVVSTAPKPQQQTTSPSGPMLTGDHSSSVLDSTKTKLRDFASSKNPSLKTSSSKKGTTSKYQSKQSKQSLSSLLASRMPMGAQSFVIPQMPTSLPHCMDSFLSNTLPGSKDSVYGSFLSDSAGGVANTPPFNLSAPFPPTSLLPVSSGARNGSAGSRMQAGNLVPHSKPINVPAAAYRSDGGSFSHSSTPSLHSGGSSSKSSCSVSTMGRVPISALPVKTVSSVVSRPPAAMQNEPSASPSLLNGNRPCTYRSASTATSGMPRGVSLSSATPNSLNISPGTAQSSNPSFPSATFHTIRSRSMSTSSSGLSPSPPPPPPPMSGEKLQSLSLQHNRRRKNTVHHTGGGGGGGGLSPSEGWPMMMKLPPSSSSSSSSFSTTSSTGPHVPMLQPRASMQGESHEKDTTTLAPSASSKVPASPSIVTLLTGISASSKPGLMPSTAQISQPCVSRPNPSFSSPNSLCFTSESLKPAPCSSRSSSSSSLPLHQPSLSSSNPPSRSLYQSSLPSSSNSSNSGSATTLDTALQPSSLSQPPMVTSMQSKQVASLDKGVMTEKGRKTPSAPLEVNMKTDHKSGQTSAVHSSPPKPSSKKRLASLATARRVQSNNDPFSPPPPPPVSKFSLSSFPSLSPSLMVANPPSKQCSEAAEITIPPSPSVWLADRASTTPIPKSATSTAYNNGFSQKTGDFADRKPRVSTPPVPKNRSYTTSNGHSQKTGGTEIRAVDSHRVGTKQMRAGADQTRAVPLSADRGHSQKGGGMPLYNTADSGHSQRTGISVSPVGDSSPGLMPVGGGANQTTAMAQLSKMTRWEIEQLYYYNAAILEEQKCLTNMIEGHLLKMEQENKETNIFRKRSKSEVYNDLLKYLVEPDCSPDDEGSIRLVGHCGTSSADYSDVIIGGTPYQPIINSKYDVYKTILKNTKS